MGRKDWQVQGNMTAEQFKLELRRRASALKSMVESDGWKYMLESLTTKEEEALQTMPVSGEDALGRLAAVRSYRYLTTAPQEWIAQIESALSQE